MKRCGILIVMLLWVGRLCAQTDSLPALNEVLSVDSMPVREGVVSVRPLCSHDTSLLVLHPLNQTNSRVYEVFLPDSMIRHTLRYEYTKIKDFADKNRLTRELYKIVFVNPQPGQVNAMRVQNSETRFLGYAGKTINGITVKVLPPYGTSVYDTTYFEEDLGWLKNLANKTHMSTAEKVILRQLTLRAKTKLNPFELVQNEVLLRELDYIDDATITVAELPTDTTQVNITIICRDKLSWGGTVESNFLNSFVLGVDNKNFMKLGHQLNYELRYRGTKDKKWGNILEYKVNSLWGSHIDVRGYYQNDHREKLVRVDLERKFLTSQMKWAGGVAAGRIYYSDKLPDRNVTRLDNLFNYHFQDLWAGRSFQLPFRYSYNRNIYLTGRFFTTFFNNRPRVNCDTNHFYYNRVNYLAAFTYSKIKYYKANLIYDFGRTEDIPAGLLVSVTGGYERSEYENFGYIAGTFRYSHFSLQNDRYYALGAALGSYMNNGNFERGVFKVDGVHISNLCNIGNLKFRYYNSVRYVRGIRRYPADHLYMEDVDIRGFSSDTLQGNQKLSFSAATTYFLPYIRRGFRIALSTFVDASMITPRNEALTKSKVYWGIGAALNLRNDNLVIKNIIFRFSFYPTIPDDGRRFQTLVSGSRRERFYDYRVTKPQIIQYY